MRNGLWIGLLIALCGSAPAMAKGKHAPVQPHALQVERFTVVCDRRPERLPEIGRRLLAMDRFLTQILQLPPERLSQPVTWLYLHRTVPGAKRLPYAGDRIGHAHLLPTDTGLIVLTNETDGLEDLRSAMIQVAEMELVRGNGELPSWLRSGLYELLARVSLEQGSLLLAPATFPDLHAAGMKRAPLQITGEPGWSRYQEPQRWYTSCLVVAYLVDEDQQTLVRAIRDPQGFSLVDSIDESAFKAWIDTVVTRRDSEPRVLGSVDVQVPYPDAITDDELSVWRAALAANHKRPKLLRPHRTTDPRSAALYELRTSGPAKACAALGQDSTSQLYTRGLCQAVSAPEDAEAAFEQAWRQQPSLSHGAVQAAALILATPGREADAAPMVESVLAAVPADPDARLLDAILQTRSGTCGTWSADDPTSLQPPWAPIRYVDGPMAKHRDQFVRELLECAAAQ